VTWARGCGFEGRVAPFGGAAKLPWNLEWAAQWSLFGVTIEPCGKDLSTAGGSRDRSDAIAREVYEREPPLNVPYEFLNIGGRKMSTSKGLGAAAHAMTAVLPPDQTRFLFVRHRPHEVIEFDPVETDAIPRLFDEFDRLAAATAGRDVKGDLPSGFDAIFRYSLRDPDADVEAEAAAYRAPFGHLALLAQVPGADVHDRVATEKGAPLDERESRILDERLGAVRAWLDGYAPARAIVAVREVLPPETAALATEQRDYLRALADAAPPGDAGGDAWQAAIFATAQSTGLEVRRAFEALYVAFIGRPNGPRAGWLLAALDRSFIDARLRLKV
jgi:lysyl-tRNA synthetase class 1